MKPYITNAEVNGKYILPYQMEGAGINYETIESAICDTCIIAYSMPKSQSLKSAWELRIYFNNNMCIDFSSAFTNIGGWQEFGSLNMKFTHKATSVNMKSNETYTYTEIDDFCIEDIKSLIYVDGDLFSECGIIFTNKNGQEFIIAAGVSPGSVTVKIPLCISEFQPEMEYETYKKVKLNLLYNYKKEFLGKNGNPPEK